MDMPASLADHNPDQEGRNNPHAGPNDFTLSRHQVDTRMTRQDWRALLADQLIRAFGGE